MIATVAAAAKKVWTEAELKGLPEDGYIHEVVNGELVSPNNTRAEIDERLRDFFDSGTQIAWIIDPEEERIEVCHSLIQRQFVGSGGFLDGEDLLPAFRYPIADLFNASEWE